MSYQERLDAIVSKATPVAMDICRRWNGENFGKPGSGWTGWVESELARIERPVHSLRGLLLVGG